MRSPISSARAHHSSTASRWRLMGGSSSRKDTRRKEELRMKKEEIMVSVVSLWERACSRLQTTCREQARSHSIAAFISGLRLCLLGLLLSALSPQLSAAGTHPCLLLTPADVQNIRANLG